MVLILQPLFNFSFESLKCKEVLILNQNFTVYPGTKTSNYTFRSSVA